MSPKKSKKVNCLSGHGLKSGPIAEVSACSALKSEARMMLMATTTASADGRHSIEMWCSVRSCSGKTKMANVISADCHVLSCHSGKTRVMESAHASKK